MIDIVDYLTEKGHVCKPGGNGNIRTLCFFHGEEENKPGRLYINVEDEDKYGIYFCFVCGQRGSFNKIRRFFGDEPISMTPNESINPIIEVAAQYYSDKLFENTDAYSYLQDDRGLTDETISQARLGWADGNLAAYLLSRDFPPEAIKESGLVKIDGSDYFHNEIIFPYMQFGRAVQLRGKRIGGITKGMKGVQTVIYNGDSILGETTVIVNEGEIDTLTMQQLGFNAIGVPGVNTWKDEWTEQLDESKRVYILFDADAAGRAGAEKLASILGHRSRIVELPKKGIDVNDYYIKYGKLKEDFDFLFSKAKGGILVTVHQAFDKWTEIEGNSDLVGLKFNIGPIDKAMSYGQLPGQVVVTLGRTDSGKSIDVLNKIVRNRLVDDDFKCLLVSLELTRNEIFERLYRIQNFYFPGSTVIDTVNYWEKNLLIVDKNRVSEQELVDCIEQSSYEAGRTPDKIVVDYLGYYSRSFTGNAKERTAEAIMGLKRIAKEFETVIEVPVQGNRTGEIGEAMTFEMAADASEVEHTANIMFAIWKPDQKLKKDPENSDIKVGDVYQQIIKSKNGGNGTIMRYHFTPLTLALVPWDDELYDFALKERQWAAAGDTLAEINERRLTGFVGI